MISFKDFLNKNKKENNTSILIVIYQDGAHELDVLQEGKWIKASYDKEIRIDRNTHLQSGTKHAHIYDRKGNEVFALTQGGKPSHNAKSFRLSKVQADELRSQGFNIPKNRIIEAVLVDTAKLLLLG